MPTTLIAGREYNVVQHYRRRRDPKDGESKLTLVGVQLERLDKKDRTISGRQRRLARKAAKRAA